ncbi:AraC-like protein [Anaerobacterium chartisolvens]|uniref:AraC-like protein n=1 Tax=Anaerobacterium chartisolvens TaxID=1297424 RepID=A0A369ANS3_9FIRM|nr:AraC family transcriptional regulator [Anaerobacterium chartisolvens]RCX09926.1 AraC-like protein [Anaerobacterium chartisolvens]
MEIVTVGKSMQVYNSFPVHQHGYWEVILNLQGTGTATIDNKEYSFKEGTIFYIPPETPHRKVSEEGFMDACLFIKDFTPLNNEKIGIFQDDVSQTFRNLILLAFDIFIKNITNANSILNSLGETMYQLLVSFNTETQKRNSLIGTFTNIMVNNISNCHFDIAKEVENTGYCKGYFRKIFKEVTGTSPVSYFNNIRIEYAKRQFQQYQGKCPVKQVSLESGFRDQYYFSRIFKQYTGISPQQYAKQLGEYEVEKVVGSSPDKLYEKTIGI